MFLQPHESCICCAHFNVRGIETYVCVSLSEKFSSYVTTYETKNMQIRNISIGLPSEFQHVVVITTSRQPYDLNGVTTIFLYDEAKQYNFLLQLIPTFLTVLYKNSHSSNIDPFAPSHLNEYISNILQFFHLLCMFNLPNLFYRPLITRYKQSYVCGRGY